MDLDYPPSSLSFHVCVFGEGYILQRPENNISLSSLGTSHLGLFCLFSFIEVGIYYAAVTGLKLTMQIRLVSDSQKSIRLPLPLKCRD